MNKYIYMSKAVSFYSAVVLYYICLVEYNDVVNLYVKYYKIKVILPAVYFAHLSTMLTYWYC